MIKTSTCENCGIVCRIYGIIINNAIKKVIDEKEYWLCGQCKEGNQIKSKKKTITRKMADIVFSRRMWLGQNIK